LQDGSGLAGMLKKDLFASLVFQMDLISTQYKWLFSTQCQHSNQ